MMKVGYECTTTFDFENGNNSVVRLYQISCFCEKMKTNKKKLGKKMIKLYKQVAGQ